MDSLILTRTKAALEQYDKRVPELENELNEILSKSGKPPYKDRSEDFDRLLRAMDDEAKKVAYAFWEDTKDRNTLDNCMLLRPGPKDEKSFIREQVAKYGSPVVNKEVRTSNVTGEPQYAPTPCIT